MHTRVKGNFELNLITTRPPVSHIRGGGKKHTLAPQHLGDTVHTHGDASYPTWHSLHAFLHAQASEDIPQHQAPPPTASGVSCCARWALAELLAPGLPKPHGLLPLYLASIRDLSLIASARHHTLLLF